MSLLEIQSNSNFEEIETPVKINEKGNSYVKKVEKRGKNLFLTLSTVAAMGLTNDISAQDNGEKNPFGHEYNTEQASFTMPSSSIIIKGEELVLQQDGSIIVSNLEFGKNNETGKKQGNVIGYFNKHTKKDQRLQTLISDEDGASAFGVISWRISQMLTNEDDRIEVTVKFNKDENGDVLYFRPVKARHVPKEYQEGP